jgi:hypothetical protein
MRDTAPRTDVRKNFPVKEIPIITFSTSS